MQHPGLCQPCSSCSSNWQDLHSQLLPHTPVIFLKVLHASGTSPYLGWMEQLKTLPGSKSLCCSKKTLHGCIYPIVSTMAHNSSKRQQAPFLHDTFGIHTQAICYQAHNLRRSDPRSVGNHLDGLRDKPRWSDNNWSGREVYVFVFHRLYGKLRGKPWKSSFYVRTKLNHLDKMELLQIAEIQTKLIQMVFAQVFK